MLTESGVVSIQLLQTAFGRDLHGRQPRKARKCGYAFRKNARQRAGTFHQAFGKIRSTAQSSTYVAQPPHAFVLFVKSKSARALRRYHTSKRSSRIHLGISVDNASPFAQSNMHTYCAGAHEFRFLGIQSQSPYVAGVQSVRLPAKILKILE